MATNKHAIIRYRVIDKCLRQVDKTWNWKSLAEACAAELKRATNTKTTLSERTIKGDLQNMRNDKALGYFAPIEYDRKEKTYYYSRRDYSITEAPLNRSDSQELKNAISLLRQFTGFRHLQGIDNIIQKLELLAYESRSKSKRFVHLAQPVSIPGQKWLDQLYDAIKKEKPLMMTYKPFDREAFSGVISPYLLKEFDNRWYLYANFHSKNQLRTYGLERITRLNKSLQDYIPSEDFEPDTYFKDIVGVTLAQGQKTKKITFEVYGYTVQYIQTKPIHFSQKLISEEKRKSLFEVELIPNYELESLLLSYGENLKVIKPKNLANKLKARISKMNAMYN
ncbi:MAG: WYL domain-containing protein [Saprospiraceae bacterium]|nr:WYL domain-containing protein [Bacteroidia bacterium]NNE15097.1 WYL domain-containing protein [Saprospiraceae bacterium]NNL93841.1 WYL domain-containing protein [Saprospiraceae bacterium]